MPSTSELSSSSTETIVPIQSNEIHLLTLVHGMWGTPSHVGRLSEVIAETYSKGLEYGAELNVLIAEANKDNHTYDGVDWCAERVVEEIQERIRLLEFDPSSPRKVTRFSIMGYSLGGLVSRYAIGILHSQKFFERVTPVNFTTIATPHIGLVRYPTWIGSIKTMLGPIFLSRTGQHFFATDKWSDEQPKPLLEVMSEKDGIFYQGLCEFRNVTLYANIINDLTVPFVTSAIETCDPFINYDVNGIEM
ncbi:hypothetical protein FRC02_011808 [Tulasnella sp. 418]|nr:hypothetical protein FRC02_011808 [Tulasnella sp. 418]